jgi:hypothetical protein
MKNQRNMSRHNDRFSSSTAHNNHRVQSKGRQKITQANQADTLYVSEIIASAMNSHTISIRIVVVL